MTKRKSTAAGKRHMGRVAALGCCVCHQAAGCHHIRDGYGMAQRASDFETIPLCHLHHQGALGFHHLGSNVWETMFKPERVFLAETLERLGMVQHEMPGAKVSQRYVYLPKG